MTCTPATTRNLSELSDEQLARQLQGGCMQSFEELDRRYRPRLLYLLSRRLPQFHDAEDVVQQALVRVYRKISQYSPNRRLSPWIFTIALRLAAEQARRKQVPPGPTGDETEQSLDSRQLPEEQAATKETHQQIWNLAREVLKTEQWTALWLFYGEELSLAEVAQALGRTKTGTSVVLFRARKTLEPHVEKLLAHESKLMKCEEFADEGAAYPPELLLESKS